MAAKLTNQFLPGSRTTFRARELKQPAESGAASRSASGLHGGQFGKDGWSNLRGGHGSGPFEPRHRGWAVARRLQQPRRRRALFGDPACHLPRNAGRLLRSRARI